MQKIKFNLDFLGDSQLEKTHTPCGSDQQTEDSCKIILIALTVLFISLIFGVCLYGEYYNNKQEKIATLFERALYYKKFSPEHTDGIIFELAQLTNADFQEISDKLSYLVQKEKYDTLRLLVNADIENNYKDSTQEQAYIKTYFNGKVEDYKKAYDREFLIQKNSTVNHLLQLWKTSPAAFNNIKEKYVKSLFNNDLNLFNQALDDALGYKNFTLVEQKLPKNGIIKNYTHRKPIAPLKIITPNYQFPRYGTIHNENFYIKLIDSTSGRLAVTIFVRPGSSFEIAVPTGVYEMRYASGKTWYGEKDLFGPETSYNKSDNLLSFLDKGYYLQGQSLTLYKTPNGNLSTQEIDASDF